MNYWPAALPTMMPIETEEAAQDNVIRTDMDMGPPKSRQRGTAFSIYLKPNTARWLFNELQMTTLFTFHDVDQKSGSMNFIWHSPVRSLIGQQAECRFGGRPKIAMVSPQGGDSIYRISMAIEVVDHYAP